MGMQKTSKPIDYLVDIQQSDSPWEEAKAKLSSLGFVAIRNLFGSDTVDEVAIRAGKVFSRPAIGGSVGYYRKDPNKRLYDPLLIGGRVVDLITNEYVFDLVELYLNGPFTLAELNLKHDDGNGKVYFPLHADFAAGWKMKNYEVTLAEEDLINPIAVGAMLYLHDTAEGAFCYSRGSHELRAPHGTSIAGYPDDLRNQIVGNLVRVEGNKGDLVLFDDRGFHGPEQPTIASRTVLLFDYYKDAVFGGATKMAIPALINDLGNLNERQLKVMGFGAKSMDTYENYHSRQFAAHKNFDVIARRFEGKFLRERRKAGARDMVKRLLGRGTRMTMSGK
jgi:Phytanoyl-CoA dioxygenase (PhyH)